MSSEKQNTRAVADTVWLLLLGTAMAVNIWLIFGFAPLERTMGLMQKVFYFHVPAAWVSFLAFFVTFCGSITYLITKREGADRLAAASAGLGTVFCTMVLITGPLWAKPIWGIWWTWDARLTSTFVLWLLFLSYLILRSYLPATGTRRQTLSAVIGILGFLNVPIVYMSIRWWRTQHPQPVIAGGDDSGLAPDMLVTFFFSLFVFTLLYWVLLRLRLRQDVSERKLRALQRRETAR